MTDKLTTHRRFIRKAEKDLIQLYNEEKYHDFIKNYEKFCDISYPEPYLEEYYYESLNSIGAYQTIIDYALKSMNTDQGNYQLHMLEMLRALKHMERYYDVITFVDQLMAERIPQRFRMEIAKERHEAKTKLEEEVDDTSYPYSGETSDIDVEEMTKEEILQFLDSISEAKDERFEGKIISHLTETNAPEVVTFMLLYLKDIQCAEEVLYGKFGQSHSIVPRDLPDLEDTRLVNEVLPRVLNHIEEKSPEMVDEAKMLLMSHAIYSYPKDSGIDTFDLVNAYLSYIYSLINIEAGMEISDRAMEWIYKLEEEMEHRQ